MSVLSLCDISPVFLDRGLVVVCPSFEDIFGKILHTQINGDLVIFGDASVLAVQFIEVVCGGCFCLSSADVHCYLIIIAFPL